MVVFRLTQEEYASLREACKSKGGRNLSEFTRSELLAMLHAEPIATVIHHQFQELQEQLLRLETAVVQVSDTLACGNSSWSSGECRHAAETE
jgi:hypothetical protein